jgi:L-threonylcarbamoyladenylate synthase
VRGELIHINEIGNKELVTKIVDNLSKDSAVALLPTETVYGLVCRWNDETAKSRIYDLKVRDRDKPFQMMISSFEIIKYKFEFINADTVFKIADAFTPGPITIVANTVNAGKIGFRVPNHKLFLDVLSELNQPLAATSANLSGAPLCIRVEDAIATLNGELDLIIDGGEISVDSQPSTVVEVLASSINIIREGPISYNELISVL